MISFEETDPFFNFRGEKEGGIGEFDIFRKTRKVTKKTNQEHRIAGRGHGKRSRGNYQSVRAEVPEFPVFPKAITKA